MEQARSRGLLKDAFAGQLKDRSIAGRRKLAQALLDEVPKTADNPSDEYVLLGGAIEASKDAGALALCSQAADTMAAQYEVDALSIKTDAAPKMDLRGDSPATAAENVRVAMELTDSLLAAEDFPAAAKILATARRAAASDPALVSAVQKRMQAVESARAAHDRVAASLEKLKTSPDDPAANLAVGSYLCFSRSDWEQGLGPLARSSDANLKQVATLELSRPKASEDVIRLADRWWEIAAKQPDTIRSAIHQHAASFYKTALEGVTGLQKTRMEHRIAEASADQFASRQAGASLPHSGSDITINSIGMKFVFIKPGIFLMGSPPTEADRDGNEVPHHVKISKPFLMAATTVTQGQWKAVMGNNPSRFQGDNRPVEMVSWDDAVAFCEKLSEKEGKHYRLPTEAEWEYACRAGTQTPYNFGGGHLDDFVWYLRNAGQQSHDVATKKPNRWGLYDMNGNVWQWCLDSDGPYAGDAVDPKNPGTSSHPQRGGSWNGDERNCRSAFRSGRPPGARYPDLGFRVCMEP
jgi:formylglycine-generating enzyme required for sulfatase activity